MGKKKTFTKRDLAERLHQRFGFSVRSMYHLVDAMLEEIKLALERGEEVKIVHFGTFKVKHKKPRPGVNPRTKEKMWLPGGKTVIFKVSPTLKALLHAQKE